MVWLPQANHGVTHSWEARGVMGDSRQGRSYPSWERLEWTQGKKEEAVKSMLERLDAKLKET